MSGMLGKTKRGKTVSLTPLDRSTHLHVLGGSGFGKSTLLENMLRADVMAGHGLCLIDPHGTLADALAAFCSSRGIERFRQVHLIEPGTSDWCVGFNPVRLDGSTEPAARVDAMVAACAAVWGGSDLSAMPLLKKCLRALFYVLAVRGLTLAEAPELISGASPLRHELTRDLPDYVFDALWRDFNALSRREFTDQFASTGNRMIEFLSSPVIRRIVGQRERILDLKKAMEEGEIVIVNLAEGGGISRDNARLLGTLLCSELFLLAKTRTPADAARRPFYLYIDECYQFLTADVEAMLDQTRKFGLHVCLSHQRLGQLGDERSPLRNGVMAGAQTKVVFGGLEDDDAEVMARQILRDQFNLERPKRVLDKLVVVDEVPFWLESESTTTSSNESFSYSSGTTSSTGTSTNTGASLGVQYPYDEDAIEIEPTSFTVGVQQGTSDSAGAGESYSETRSRGTGESSTRGWSQTLKAVREKQPTAVYSLQEEIHRAIVRLRRLPVGTAIVRVRGKTAVEIKVPQSTKPVVWPELLDRFREDVSANNPSQSRRGRADEEMAARRAGMSGGQSSESGFWEEER